MLRGGGLTQALELCSAQYRLMVEQKMNRLNPYWKRNGDRLPNELPEDSALLLTLAIVDYRPPNEEAGASVLTQWMADLGMLGERPGDELKEDSISEQLFKMLLESDTPISLDDADEAIPGQKARLGRMFERFRTCGLVERIPRTDRLPMALWSAMIAQHQRRGEDWMLKKGGFMRLIPESQHASLLKPLAKGKLTVEVVETTMKEISSTDQMLLLNLLGGRLPLGYRMIGESSEAAKQNVIARLDRVLRRIRRVGDMIEEVLATGDE